jgi:hypothetical protein
MFDPHDETFFKGKSYVGFNASKNSWFTGLKVHILTTYHGQPKEFLFTPGSEHDLSALKKMYLGTIPKGATLFGDKAYTSYGKKIRKKIETAFSRLIAWLPRRIHAVSELGVQLKLMMLITAFSLSFLG